MMTRLLNSETMAFFLLLLLLECSAVIADSTDKGKYGKKDGLMENNFSSLSPFRSHFVKFYRTAYSITKRPPHPTIFAISGEKQCRNFVG